MKRMIIVHDNRALTVDLGDAGAGGSKNYKGYQRLDYLHQTTEKVECNRYSIQW